MDFISIQSLRFDNIGAYIPQIEICFEDVNGQVSLLLDCKTNCAKFLDIPAEEVEINENWVEWKEICGSWSICSPDSDWDILFDSDDLDYVEEGSGDLSEELKNAVLQTINSKTLFLLTEEVLKSSK